MHEFDGDTWRYKALMDYVAFKELHEFVNNDMATAAHINSYELVGDVGAFSEAQLDEIRTSKICTLKEALSHFGNQTIISLCTAFEVCTREYLRALFLIKPLAMFDFLGSEESRGQIPLKEILQVSSHADLLARLAARASGAASKGKYGQRYSKALSFSEYSENKGMEEKLNSLQADRNKLVHERHRPMIGLEEVRSAHELVDEAIEELCQAGIHLGIPGQYTCVEPDIQLVMESAVSVIRKDV